MTDKKPVEIEVKIPIGDMHEIGQRLEQKGFVRAAVHEETDTYYNSTYYDLKEHDKALRIRKVVDRTHGKSWSELNCKGPKLDDVSVSRKEIEMVIENSERMEAILAELGFFSVKCTVRKIRYHFNRGRITAVLDRVENIGDFLELEILEFGEDKRAECLQEIEKVMEEIGFSMKDTVRTSYLSMLQK